MSRLANFLVSVEDPTTLEEMGERFNHLGLTGEVDILAATTNVEIRGIRTHELIDFIVKHELDIGYVEYFGVYTDDYIEPHLSAEQLDREYKLVITTTVQIFPPL